MSIPRRRELHNKLPSVLADLAEEYSDLSQLDLYEEMKNEIPAVLSQISTEYIPAKDLVELFKHHQIEVPTELWQRLLKEERPDLYEVLITGINPVPNLELHELVLMIRSGLYKPEYVFIHAPMIHSDREMITYLQLVRDTFPNFDFQRLYNKISTNLRRNTMILSIVHLSRLGVTLDQPTTKLLQVLKLLRLDRLGATLEEVTTKIPVKGSYSQELLRQICELIWADPRRSQTPHLINKIIAMKHSLDFTNA